MILNLLLLLANILVLAWAAGIAQIMEKELPWWRRRFRLACLPREDHLFWLAPMRRGYTWERAECSAYTFTIWQLPRAYFTALRLGARRQEVWVKWL